MMANKINSIVLNKLSVSFCVNNSQNNVLEDLDVEFNEGEIIGIIGESGSGKSVLGMTILGILPPYANVSGEIIFEGERIKYLSKEQKNLLGMKVGFIPQNPEEALNPSRKIKAQIYEALKLKYKFKDETKEKANEVLLELGFKDTKKILNSYPYELSGGMQQRVLAAISVSCRASWIIADEPTKGLDESACIQVINLFKSIKEKYAKGLIIITHDINFAKSICSRILVMYKGHIVEDGTDVLENPKHPYTKDLIKSMPENDLIPIRRIYSEKGNGCIYFSRCKYSKECCKISKPKKHRTNDREFAECFLYYE